MNVDNINNKAVENNYLKNLFDIKNIYEKVGKRDEIKKIRNKSIIKGICCSAALIVLMPMFLPAPTLAFVVLGGMNFSFYRKYKKESDNMLNASLAKNEVVNSAFKSLSMIDCKTKTDYFLKMKVLSVAKDFAKSTSVPKLLKNQFIEEIDTRLSTLNRSNPFFKIDLKKSSKELELSNIFSLNTVDLLELKKSMNLSIQRFKADPILNNIFTNADLKKLNSIDLPEEVVEASTNTNKVTLPREVKNGNQPTTDIHENIEQPTQTNVSNNEMSSITGGILGEKIKLNRTLKETEDKLNHVLTFSDFLTLNEKTNLKDIQNDLSSVKEITKQNIYEDKDIVNKIYELFNDQDKIITRISDRLSKSNNIEQKPNTLTMKSSM